MSFKLEVEKANRIAEQQTEEVIQAACIAMFSKVLKATPVDEGGARNNWFTSLHAEPQLQKRRSLKRGGEANNEMLNTVMNYKLGNRVFFINRMPYINVLEFGRYPNPPKGGKGKTQGGFSKQAPRGMVRVNVAKWRNIVSSIARRRRG
jgi:hypothetical protein